MAAAVSTVGAVNRVPVRPSVYCYALLDILNEDILSYIYALLFEYYKHLV